MFLPEISIRRPVLATVVTLAIVLAGGIGFLNLPVRELPDVEFPIVSVTTVLPGASPEVVETEVTEVLEEEINTIEGIKTLTSISADNTSIITAEFELDRDVDLALQDVRAKVSRIRGGLPDDVDDPVIDKLDPEASPIIWLPVRAPGVPLTDVNDFADNVLKERLQNLPGVGSVILGGQQRFAVRIRLDAQRLAGYDLTVDDVRQALQSGNVDLPSGRLEGRSREFTVRTEGEFPTPRAFNDLIVAWRDGAPVYLRDVGVAEPGVENTRNVARFNGEPTVGVGVVKQSDANTVEVAHLVLEEVERLRETLPPGYTIDVAVNNALFVEQSVEEVEETILIALLLVVAVILFFLRSWRATVIPALAIPVSLVGTFAALYLLDFSINTLTLLALVLAIGIVVDDAIVVVENIYRHMEEGHEDPVKAAREGSSEIAFAVLAISLTLVIVFLPVAFISGVVGRLFREFGLSVAVSVAISAFVALTLTPMLSSRFLRPHTGGENAFFRWADRVLRRVEAAYRATLEVALRRRLLVTGVAVASLAGSLGLMAALGREFVPPEDRGQFLVLVSAPEGATLDYTDRYQRQVEEVVARTEGVDGFFSAIGLAIGGPPSVNNGLLFVRLLQDRKRGQFEIMDEIRAGVAHLAGVNVFLVAPNSLDPGGFEQPLQYVIQGPDLDGLFDVSQRLAARARAIPGLVGVDTDVDLNKPQFRITVDRPRAAELGVEVAEIATTLQVLLGGSDLSEYKEGSERYEVMVQLEDSLRTGPDDLRSIFVRGRDGGLVQLASVVDVTETVGPNQISHFNRRRAITLAASPLGIPLGEALARVEAVAAEEIPDGYQTTVTGQTQDFQESFGSLVFALLMAVVAVYLVLAGQFESFVHPFTIMLALPLALVGAAVSLFLFGMTLNIYSMIGIIMLMGLVTKNSILLVDFANQERARGTPREQAVMRAGLVRLRPILMTSVALIFGVLPIALGLGAGAESRRPLGAVVIGGMISSTALTLLVVPVFYLMIDEALEWWLALRARRRRKATPAAGVALLLAGAFALLPLPAGAQAQAGTRAGAQVRAGAEPGGLALGLEEAVARAVTVNEDVLVARAEKARLEGSVTEVRARSLPELSLDVGYTRNLQTPVLFFNTPTGTEQISIGNDHDYAFGLNLSQPLVDFALGPARTAARLAASSSDALVESVRVAVAAEVRAAYYTVLLDEALLGVQEQALEQARARLAQVRSFAEAGTASEFDLLTAEVEVDNIRPLVIEAANQLELDRDRLKRLLGLPLDTPLTLTDGLALPGAEPTLEAATEAALSARPDLRSQELRVELQDASVSAEKRSLFPTLSLNASFLRRASSNDFLPPERDFSQSLATGLVFSLPLFDGRERSGRIQQAEAARTRERFRLSQQREEVRLEVLEAHRSLAAARERIDASRSNVGRAERALEIAQVRFANGLGTQLELNDAELAVTQARTNAVQALYAYNLAMTRLRRAMGER
ncbi:MAG: efflux RND transporter permease subunit [Longimicrobiales bacterium]|nr:efflux RND transporter permease subunit [Longimicrobiales bacterium]